MIDQPALPKYRIPVFRQLASLDGIDLTVSYGTDPKLPNVEADGFKAVPVRHRSLTLKGQVFYWSAQQLRIASGRCADVIVLPWNTRYLSSWVALWRARRRGVATVLWGHGYSKAESDRRAALRDRLAAKADALLFYNHTAAEQARTRGVPDEKIFVALNALDQGPIQQARQYWLDRPDLFKDF